MAFMRNINDFILTLVALSLPSIAATIDCNGKPFHCLNSTHFMICVDFGSGVSSTMDDFVIPCPPTTVCQATNRFECEFPTVTTTSGSPIVTNSLLAATVNNDELIDTVSDVTTIPFEEYFNTISTTTVSGGDLTTRVAVTTGLPVNNLSESFYVPATDSNTNVVSALNFGVSPNYFTTLATLDMVTEETTVTELNVAENVNLNFELNSNISEGFTNATEIVPTDIDPINLNENNTIDVTENYESNSTLLETIIGATNFRQFNTPLYNTTSYDVTEPILSEVTENILSLPIDEKQVYLTTLEASPDVILYNITIENVTESIPTETTKYRRQFQSNLTLNEAMSTGDIVKNDSTTLNTSLDTNGFALNPDLSFHEITTKYEEEISTAEQVLFEVKENTTNIPVDEQVYLPTPDASPDVFLDDQTIDNATESILSKTTEYNRLIEPQSNRFNNKPLNKSTSYDITEPILLSDVTENIISIPVDDKQAYLSTLEASSDVVLGDHTIDNVTKTVLAVKTYYKHLNESQNNSTSNKSTSMSGGDIVQNDTTKLKTVLTTNESALNVNNSDTYFDEITTKYEEQISTAELILNEAKENELEHKQAYLTLDASLDVVWDNKSIDTVTESIPTETTEYRHSIESQSNSTLNATMSSGDTEQSYTTTVNAVNTNESATNVHDYNLSLNEDTQTFYKEKISAARNNYELSGNTATEITQPNRTEITNITEPKLSISMIATTSVHTESISTNTSNAAINTGAAVTEKFNVIEYGNKTSIFDDLQTTELSFKDPNHYLTSTEDSATALVTEFSSDNTSVKPENNTNPTQGENFTSVNYVENVTQTETETEEINLVLPKPPRSNETTTIVHGKHSSADNTSTTYTIPNIDNIIAQNKTTFQDFSARNDEVPRVLTSDVNLSHKIADATENNQLLQPLTKPTSTPLSKIAHNVLGSDLTNENSLQMSSFMNRIELTARSNVTNKTLTHNVIGSDMNNSTEITGTPSNHIELNNIMSVSTADDQINTVKISESTPNYILETATQEVDSFTYNNVYYQTDIEEISHDPRNNILSAETIESTPSILVLTTESTKEPHFDEVIQATTSFNGVSDKMYAAENDTYLTNTTNSPQPESTPSTAFDSINSTVHPNTSKPETRDYKVEEISTLTSKLEITSAINENSYIVEQNIPATDIINSPQQTAITSSTAFVNTNSAVHQVQQVTRKVVEGKISTDPSMLLISFTMNKTAYDALEQTIQSAEATPESADLFSDRFKYPTNTETANDSVYQESRITIVSDSLTTKRSESSALSAQNNRGIKETLIANTTPNTATNFSAIPNLTVSNLSGAGSTNFGEEINGITDVDSLTTEKTVDAISKPSTDNEKENINPENIRKSIKINTTTEDITVIDGTKQTESLRSYSNQRENISKLEITSVDTDKTTLASFIADDIYYTENINKLAYIQDRVLSNAQTEPNIPEIFSERFGANVYDPNFSVNKETFIDGLTSIDTAVAKDTKLTRNEISQQSPGKLVTPKISTTETLLSDTLKKKHVLPVMPELKTNSEFIVKTPKSNGDIKANPIVTNKTSSFESLTERKLSFITSIQESKYKSKSNLASSTESWRATVVTEPVVHLTRPYIETLITSSKPYTESNDQVSQDISSVTPKLNLARPSKEQYINPTQNIESATKNVLTSLESSVIFPQVTESSGVANQDVQSSSVRKSTSQKSYGIDTQKLVPNQGVSSTENHYINVTPLAIPSTITKPVDLLTKKSFTAPNTQILAEHHVLKKVEQINVPTTEKLKVNVIPIISPSVNNKTLVDVTAVPILKSSNNISKDVMPNTNTHLITAVYSSNLTVESVPRAELNKIHLNITSTTEKTMTKNSDLDIVMVDVVNTDSLNLGEIAPRSNNTHSGISATQKSTSQQIEKHKGNKSVTKDQHETEMEEKPEVTETNPSNDKIKHLTSTEGIPIKKQGNVQHNPPLNTKQKPVQNVTTRTSPVDSHVKNTLQPRFNTKTKSSVANKYNSTLPASEKSKQNFVCKSHNRGRFSDNEDCRKFYVCIGKHEPIKGICPNNTVFSELRKQCTKNLSHCVRNNQFQCVSEGRFSDYFNDNIYYICVNNTANTFIRFKLQCQNGYQVNKTSVRCVMNTESIISSSQPSQQSASEVSTSNQSISAKSEKIKEKPKTKNRFQCKRSGKFPEPNDCRKYYVCRKLGKSEFRQRNKKCDSDEVYNRDKKKCVDADSYECS